MAVLFNDYLSHLLSKHLTMNSYLQVLSSDDIIITIKNNVCTMLFIATPLHNWYLVKEMCTGKVYVSEMENILDF